LIDRDEVLVALGDSENRVEELTSLLHLAEELEEPTQLAEAYYRQAVFFENTGDEHKALEISHSALQAARKAGNQSLEMRVLTLMLICQTRLGELKVASALADDLLLRSRGLEDESVLARILTNVALYYSETGDIAKAIQLGERQIEINHRLGDRVGEAIGLGNVGYNYLQLGQFEKGRDALEQSLKLNEALGARRIRAYNLLNLGLCNWRSGDADSAQRVLEQALPEFETMCDAFGRGAGLSYMALALEHEEDLKDAMKYFTEAREILAELGIRGFEYDTIAGLARCSWGQGSKEESQKYATELWDYLSHNNAKGMEFPVWAYQTCATVFESYGDDKKSQDAIEAGYQTLMTQADNISNANLRNSYLETVPEHRAMIEMWNRMIR
jgi:tetratricopeptide (TPR) repeat protein